MARLFSLQVHTPYRLFFSGQVEAFVADIADGQIGVRAGRSPFTAPLKTCILRILDADGVWKIAAVTEGVIEVTFDGAVVLSGAAEWPQEIDRLRAEDALKRAEERLGASMLKFEASRARSSLLRAQNRLKAINS
ncbi:MAG: ATP synthase F1 subunit epsilon [Treponemataceae bacterium]